MIEQHVLDLIPGYALDCLDVEEEMQVAEHLATCSTCRLELDSYRLLVGELPEAMAMSEPPPNLRDRILQRAREGRAPTAVAAPKPAGWRLLPAWSMLSLVVVVLLGASNLLLWSRLNALERRSQNQLQTVLMRGTSYTPDATGLLVISLDGTHGTLVVDQLPVLDENHQYQLWLIRDGQRTDGGVFSVDEKGYKSLYIKSPELLVSYSGFGVTVEPAGGSPGPTGEKVLGGDL